MNKGLKRKATMMLASLAMVLPTVLMTMPANYAMAADSLSTDIYGSVENIGSEAGISTEVELPAMIGGIIRQVLTVLGIILVLLIIYAGFLWMTAGGNTEQIDKAKKLMINAVIGLIIMFAAYAITQFVLDAIFEGTGVS